MCVLVLSQIQDAKSGFLVNGFLTVSATVLLLEESLQFARDAEGASASESLRCGAARSATHKYRCHRANVWTPAKESACRMQVIGHVQSCSMGMQCNTFI